MNGEYTPGAIFGELAALRLNKVRSLTIRAKTDAVVYELEGGDFEESFLDRPEVPHHMPRTWLLEFCMSTLPFP